MNKGGNNAEMQGHSFKKKVDTEDGGNAAAIIAVLLFLAIMFCVALIFFLRARAQEKAREVVFAKPRYRNGVEVKPSEVKTADSSVKIAKNDINVTVDEENTE